MKIFEWLAAVLGILLVAALACAFVTVGGYWPLHMPMPHWLRAALVIVGPFFGLWAALFLVSRLAKQRL